MVVFDAAETAAFLPYPELADEIAAVLRAAARGEVNALERGTLPLPGDGTFLAMAAADARAAIVKVGSVHPRNAGRSLPTVQAVVVVIDAVDGRPRLVLDGTTVTTRRTAALSLLAARSTAARTRTLLVVGAGTQARGHVEAFTAGLAVERLFVYGRDPRKAEALAKHATGLGVAAEVVAPGAFGQAVASADTVITTTNATLPVLGAAAAEALRPEATLIAVGAFTPGMAELAPAVVGRCDVVVDTLAGARSEAGDLIQAVAAGTWEWSGATELVGVLEGYERGPRPVLFKSVGHSMFDLAATRLALEAVG